MTYEEFVRNHTESEAYLAGGMNELSKKIGIGRNTLYRVMRGEYVPSEKTYRKWFPDCQFEVEKTVKFKW